MKKITHDLWARALGDEYTALETYKNCNTKIKVLHNVCGTEFYPTPGNFLAGHKCPVCAIKKAGKKRRLSHSEFIAMLSKINFIHEYKILSNYITRTTPIKVIHSTCGHIYLTTPGNILSGRRCPNCFGTQKLTQDEWGCRLKIKNCEPIGQYVTANTKTKIKNLTCGHEYEISPSNFYKSDRGCPICKESQGEGIIREGLSNSNIMFKQEYGFSNCKSLPTNNRRMGTSLRFDFIIFDNDIPVAAIEYDGEHHYMTVPGWDSCDNYKKRDNIKNKYCIDHDILMLRIPYTQKNYIKTIVEGFIKSLQQEVVSREK